MQAVSFDVVVGRIVTIDPRYHEDAYHFVKEALDFTQREIRKLNADQDRHITGQELLDGIRKYGLKEFGPMTLSVFQEWGITRCEDFGEIVFNLIDCDQLKKTDSDRREDFAGGYDFQEAFLVPFLPASKRADYFAERPAN